MVPGRIPYAAAMIHTLCPDRRAPIQIRLDLRPVRSGKNHSFDPAAVKHKWQQTWLQLNADLGSGLTLSLNRECFESEHETTEGLYRVRHTFAMHQLQGSLRYPAASFPALQAQGSQLCTYITHQLSPSVARSSVVQHDSGVVSISSGGVQPVPAAANAIAGALQAAVPDDLRWLYAAWTAAARGCRWRTTARRFPRTPPAESSSGSSGSSGSSSSHSGSGSSSGASSHQSAGSASHSSTSRTHR